MKALVDESGRLYSACGLIRAVESIDGENLFLRQIAAPLVTM
jgi:hypothetical protein